MDLARGDRALGRIGPLPKYKKIDEFLAIAADVGGSERNAAEIGRRREGDAAAAGYHLDWWQSLWFVQKWPNCLG